MESYQLEQHEQQEYQVLDDDDNISVSQFSGDEILKAIHKSKNNIHEHNNDMNENNNFISDNYLDNDDNDDADDDNRNRNEIERLHMQVAQLCAEKADLAFQLRLNETTPGTELSALEDLRNEHSSCLAQRSQLLDEFNKLLDYVYEEQESHQQQVAELQNKLDLAYNSANDPPRIDLKQKIASLESEQSDTHLMISKFEPEVTPLQEAKSDNYQNIKSLQEEIFSYQRVNKDNNQIIENLRNELSLCEDASSSNRIVVELKQKLAILEAEHSSLLEQHIAAQDNETDNTTAVQDNSQLIVELKEQVTCLTDQKHVLGQQLIQCEQDNDTIDIESIMKYDEKMCEIKDELFQARNDNTSYIKTLEILQDEVNGLKENRKSLDMATNALLSAEEVITSGQRFSDLKDSHIVRLQVQRESAEQHIQRLQAVVQSHEMEKELLASFKLKEIENETQELSKTLTDLIQINKDQSESIICLQKEIKMKDEQINALSCSKINWEQTTLSLKKDVHKLQEYILNLETAETNQKNLKRQLSLVEREKFTHEKLVKETIDKAKLLKTENMKLNEQLSTLIAEKQSMESMIANLRRQLKQCLAEKSRIRENLRTSESKLNCNTEELSRLKSSLTTVKSQLSLVKSQRNKDIDRISSSETIFERKYSPRKDLLNTHYSQPEKPNEQKMMSESLSSHVLKELEELKTSYEGIKQTCEELENNLESEKRGKQSLQLELGKRNKLLDEVKCNSDALFSDKAENLSKMERELYDTHCQFNDKLALIDSEIREAKISAEELEFCNVKYMEQLKKERSDRELQSNKARQLIRESRRTIKELNQRAALSEESNNQSKLVIEQLSQRLLKSVSDYKYLQEVSMQRCEELIRESEENK